jgi:hypothetical protein
MGYGYQKRDYELFHIEGFHRPFRGLIPASLEVGKYITCLGAAQTFGCYAKKPFPVSLSEKLNMPVLNFGIAGARPSFFLKRKTFIKKANEGILSIIQIMSGRRSESNHLFNSQGGEMLMRYSDKKILGAGPAYDELIRNNSMKYVEQIVLETRANWLKNMTELLNEIKTPKILFWFSVRQPDYKIGYKNTAELFGDFPQFITQEMVEKIKPYANKYIEVISSEGLPQKLISRFTNKETTIIKRQDLGGNFKTVNDYYPSPTMHILAAQKLQPACEELLRKI